MPCSGCSAQPSFGSTTTSLCLVCGGKMPPSFYDTSSPPPLFGAAAAPHASSQASETRLPTLAVVLGLIGVLAVVSFVAGACVYIFRGRLFATRVPVRDGENLPSQTNGGTGRANRSSCFSVLTTDEDLSADESGEHVPKMPVLHPLLLNAEKPGRFQYKELLLPRLQQIQSYQAVSRPTSKAIKHQSFPFGSMKRTPVSLPGKDATASTLLKVSCSCPAGLGQVKRGVDRDVVLTCSGADENRRRSTSRDLKLVKRFSHPLPLTSSVDKSASGLSSDKCTSSSSNPPSWACRINDRSNDLFYEPGLLPSPTLPVSDMSGTVCPVSNGDIGANLAGSRKGNLVEELLKTKAQPAFFDSFVEVLTSKTTKHHARVMVCTLPLSKRHCSAIVRRTRPSVLFVGTRGYQSQAVIRAVKLRKLRSRTAKFASLRSDKYKEVETVGFVSTGEPKLRGKAQPHRKTPLRRGPSSKPKPQAELKTRSSPAKVHLKKTSAPSRASNRLPLGTVTNVLSQASANQSPTRTKTKSPPRTWPSLQLNGVPADTHAPMAPLRFKRQVSPPRNPALLNTRWMPRPATPPLAVTVFAKDRSSAASSKYPGRRLTLIPPAGTSLAELRGSIERALGYNIGALRGMVFVGKRSMFLPLLSERFYAQWVKERVREGGVGVVEAWRQNY